MDLLSPENEVKLFSNDWKIYTDTAARPSQYIGPKAQLENSILTEGCVVLGQLVNSIVFPGVYIGENTRIENSIIMENSVIDSGKVIPSQARME